MKALKLVLTGIAITICAILVIAKQTISSAKKLHLANTKLQRGVTRQYKERSLVASPLCTPFRLSY